jgi:nitrogen regulatory protein PII
LPPTWRRNPFPADPKGGKEVKEIKAFIKPHMLSKVTRALQKVDGLTGMSVTDVRGFGRGRAKGIPHRIDEDLLDYSLRMKLEILCKDERVDEIVSLIEKTAHTGLRGDGKIYVSPVEMAVRISTGDRGDEAV